MLRVNILMFLVIALCVSVVPVMAGDVGLAKTYVQKSGFRKDIEQGFKSIQIPAGGQGDLYSKFVSAINFSKIEDVYVQAIAGRLSNEEINALIKSLEIPGLHEALKKQGLAAASASDAVAAEIEKAAKSVGIAIPDRAAKKQSKPKAQAK